MHDLGYAARVAAYLFPLDIHSETLDHKLGEKHVPVQIICQRAES